MPATIDTAPPALAYSGDPIYLILESDIVPSSAPYIDILIESTGPIATQDFTFSWLGKSVNFTIVTADTDVATEIRDMNGGESLSDYADAWAEYLRQCELISDEWTVTREGMSGPAEVVRLTYKSIEHIDLMTTEDHVTNVTFVDSDVTITTGDELPRALVEVFTDTGDPNTDTLLIKQHAPFDTVSRLVRIDLSPAFATLEPHLPDPASINPALPTSIYAENTDRNWQRYYFRYAQKSGIPPVAQRLISSGDTYIAILGSRAGDSLTPDTVNRLLHDYARRDGATFRKPVSDTQPDWVYFFSNDVEELEISILITWSDGTQSTFKPFVSDSLTPQIDYAYMLSSGYRQMRLHLQTPPGGTDADAYIVAYDWRLESIDSPGTYVITVRYDVDPFPSDFGLYLLMSNGMGGCESVRLGGKQKQQYNPTAEVYQRSRWPDDQRPEPQLQLGDYNLLQASGRKSWEASTGWYSDPYYLEHLQHLPLTDAWLIDLTNRRFLRVIVEGKEMVPSQDDETLFSMLFTIRAGWYDTAYNT